MIAAPYAAPAIGGAFGLSGTLASAVGGAIFSAATSLIINAVAPPGQQRSGTPYQRVDPKRDSPTYFVSGAKNALRPDEVVPLVLGKIRHTPPLVANNYTVTEGDKQYSRQAFVWGHGPLAVSELKIGETPLETYEGVEHEFHDGNDGAPHFTLYSKDTTQNNLSLKLTGGAPWSEQTTSYGVTELAVDLTFPNGLVQFSGSGSKQQLTVTVEIEYSPAGENNWTSITTKTFTRAYTSAIRETIKKTVPSGQYDVRVRRTTPDTESSQAFDELYAFKLQTRYGSIYP